MLSELILMLMEYRVVMVTGAQRSGTTFASEIIAKRLGYECVREDKIAVDDLCLLAPYLVSSEKYVIHAPGLSSIVNLIKSPEIAIVFVRRNHNEIIESQNRIDWNKSFQKYELSKYFLEDGIISFVKSEMWGSIQSKQIGDRAFNILYDDLREDELFLEKETRKNFGVHQTK